MSKPSDPPVAPALRAVSAPALQPVAVKKVQLSENTEGMPWQSDHEIKKESNPFTDSDWRMFSYAWAGLIIRVVFIVGAIFSVYQYLENSEERRVTKTFELLAEWERPEYLEAQVALRQRIETFIRASPLGMASDASVDDIAFNMGESGKAIMSEKGGTMPLAEFEPKFLLVASFLNRVSTCVLSNQCSREMTDDYFKDLAVTFWSYFWAYSKDMRANGSTTFSRPLEEYVTGKRPETKSDIPTIENPNPPSVEN